jgi:hypothetical protein
MLVVFQDVLFALVFAGSAVGAAGFLMKLFEALASASWPPTAG